MNNLLTIVIPSKNESQGLINCIDSIKSIGSFPIIVADCSTDNTKDLVKMYHSDVILTSGGLPAVARNSGAKLCQTDYILFLDADMDISKVNLNLILDQMKYEDLLLSTCQIRVKTLFYNLSYLIFGIIQNIISRKTPFAVGGFMLFNRAEFERLGGFCELDKFAEDYHLSMKVQPKKFRKFSYPAITSDRRLKKKSVFWMALLMTRCWLNRHNDEFYKKDYNYWK